MEQCFTRHLLPGQLACELSPHLDLCLRWDRIPHTYEANNRGSNFHTSLYNPADAATFVTGSGGSVIAASSAGLGVSPNPILAGTLPI